MLKLHLFDLLWICCTTCCTTNPQQIHNKSKCLQQIESCTTFIYHSVTDVQTDKMNIAASRQHAGSKVYRSLPKLITSLGEIVSGTRNSRNIGLRIHGLNMNAAVEVSVSYNVPGLSIGILIMVYYYHVKNVSIVIYLWS